MGERPGESAAAAGDRGQRSQDGATAGEILARTGGRTTHRRTGKYRVTG